MAANDYYNTSFATATTSKPNRADDPLPPVPGNQSTTSISPVTSPFDDRRYQYPSGPAHSNTGFSDTGYHGASMANPPHGYDSPSHSTDPFADQNAIPLRPHDKVGGDSPIRYVADPEGRTYQGDYGVHPKKKKKGWLSGRVTWVVYLLTAIQVGVFVGELIKNGVLTGSPIQVKPQFNIMIGPSPYVLINMGARYPPCMHNIRGVTGEPGQPGSDEPIQWRCPRTTTDNPEDPANHCTLSQLCGMGGVPEQPVGTEFTDRSKEPDQWWRFITPIFLHAGLIHIGFNMLLQWTLGRDMEKEIGSLRFALVYFSAGIFGFVLGGNYAAPNIASTGASGSLFGILALVLLDLLYDWSNRRSPVKDLLFLLLDIAIAFVLGLLPGLDNFSHIGGFLMGIVLGVCILHSPAALRQRTGTDEPPYATVDTTPLNGGAAPGLTKFVRQPVGFFKGRKPFWWVWWLFRAGALVAVFVGFILLLRNFYEFRKECSWCYRLSCLPVKNWCDVGKFNISGQQKRSLNEDNILSPISLAKYLV
ncbi:rhomboid-domain-containing protein [Polyplosphaeria fusca]|uniref:Rhomboid-type serine protease n=1 Tax=Polyplosphaeria fusca TaxID=682080 RepID=A0A9P4R756_9PLEO|nr:rhomboid-domain-containing protein [Polyplosphaeria fusca]